MLIIQLANSQPIYTHSSNGNISNAIFQSINSPLANQDKYQYSYQYDDLYRLTEANYQYHNGANFQDVDNFDVRNLTYDSNGNLNSLWRNDETGSAVDSLSYQYFYRH